MRVALYARVSTEEQAVHGLSIDAQLAALKEAYPSGEEFVDLGISARKPISKRPELQRLLRMVERDQFDLIVFTKLDRWTRNIREYYKAQDILDAHSVAWRALHEDYETETASGRLKTNIMLAVAQDEADRTSERIKAVFEEKRRKGLVTSGGVALGLAVENGKLVPGADADRVREIFRTYISTRSMRAVAKRTGYTTSGVQYLLDNENYLNTGVIDASTWETVRNIRATRQQRHVRSDRVYLFSSIVFCPYCGTRLTSLWSKGHIYYRCRKKAEGKCPGIRFREEKLEEYLLSNLMPYVDGVLLEVDEKQKKPVDVAALKRKRDRLTDLYMDDLIDRAKYEKEYTDLADQIAKAEREPKPPDRAEILTALETYRTLSRPAKKAFWSTLIKSIVPDGDGFKFTLNCT